MDQIANLGIHSKLGRLKLFCKKTFVVNGGHIMGNNIFLDGELIEKMPIKARMRLGYRKCDNILFVVNSLLFSSTAP